MAAEEDDEMDGNDPMQSVTAGMETLEDNPDEEYYRFITGVNKQKQEKEKMKQLTYLGPSERATLGEQMLPMQDNVEMDGYHNTGHGIDMGAAMQNEHLYGENYPQQPV